MLSFSPIRSAHIKYVLYEMFLCLNIYTVHDLFSCISFIFVLQRYKIKRRKSIAKISLGEKLLRIVL